jgi:hypothetical protein
VSIALSRRAVLAALATGAAEGTRGGAAHAGPAPVVGRMLWPATGASWTYRTTVGLGGQRLGMANVTHRRLADQAFDGAACIAIGDGHITNLFQPDGSPVAVLSDNAPVARFLDRTPFAPFPLSVGASWSGRQRIHDHTRNKPVTTNVRIRVPAYEPVETPAGTFDAFRIQFEQETNVSTRWWAPGPRILVKIVTVPGAQAEPNTATVELILIAAPPVA